MFILLAGKCPKSAAIRNLIRQHGHHLETLDYTATVPTYLEENTPDIILIALEDLSDVRDFVRSVRTVSNVPLVISTRQTHMSHELQLKLLQIGADAIHVNDPPDLSIAKLEALHRLTIQADKIVSYGDITVTLRTRQLTIAGTPMKIGFRMLDVLIYLLHHPEEALHRDKFYENIWGKGHITIHNKLDTLVSKLRNQVLPHSKNLRIVSVHNVGYMLVKMPDV